MSIAVNQKVYRCHFGRKTIFLFNINDLCIFLVAAARQKKCGKEVFFDKTNDCDNSDTASFHRFQAPQREGLTTLSAFA